MEIIIRSDERRTAELTHEDIFYYIKHSLMIDEQPVYVEKAPIKTTEGKIERREGTFTTEDEEIIGGWAKVHRKDRAHPFMNEVSFREYVAMKRDSMSGKMVPNAMWTSKPGTMIRKVALVQSLREAFPSDLGGCYDSSEMGAEQ